MTDLSSHSKNIATGKYNNAKLHALTLFNDGTLFV